jgi:hypothetical protein
MRAEPRSRTASTKTVIQHAAPAVHVVCEVALSCVPAPAFIHTDIWWVAKRPELHTSYEIYLASEVVVVDDVT